MFQCCQSPSPLLFFKRQRLIPFSISRISSQFLSQNVDDFTPFSAFFLFDPGCQVVNMFLGLIFRESTKLSVPSALGAPRSRVFSQLPPSFLTFVSEFNIVQYTARGRLRHSSLPSYGAANGGGGMLDFLFYLFFYRCVLSHHTSLVCAALCQPLDLPSPKLLDLLST